MRIFWYSVATATLVVLVVFGFRGCKSSRRPLEVFVGDMRHQPKVRAQGKTPFFADRVGNRIPPAGTIPQEAPRDLDYRNTGKIGGRWGDGIPLSVDLAALERGRERYMIHCQVCHGPTGEGNGITSKYGLNGIANLHQDRFRAMSDGEIFSTITNGKGLMGAYGANISVDDRWKIITYVRALQRSQNARLQDADPEGQIKLQSTIAPAATPAR